jgi:penicillin-binding protein 1B
VRLPARILGYFLLAAALAAAGFAAFLDFRVRSEFEGRRFAIPARVYARPLELHAGARVPQGVLEEELRSLGYRESAGDGEGSFARRFGGLEIALRPFVFWDGPQEATRVRVDFARGRIASVRGADGESLELVRLDPQLIGGIYPKGNADRLLVRLAEVPPPLVKALLAIEDRRFYAHFGIDPPRVLRAAFSLVYGELQGGSTITQQLAKNFFLTRERTLGRKLTEMGMALLLELHYGKDEILETYLNEIYLGQDRDRAIHGVGLAAQFYFGKPLGRLTLAECALLAALPKGPAFYDPHRHSGRALERRNLVLREMRELGWITKEEHAAARAAPLGVAAKPGVGTSAHPAFLDLVQRQLRRDYADADLRSEGLRIFTTLDPRAQGAAERALARRLAQYERERRFAGAGLEGAVVVADPQGGEVQALAGGRDARYRGYNRALDAARSIGSLVKPAVYLTALGQPPRYTLVTPLDDGPFVWKSRGAKDWQPANFDRQFHGTVPLRTALAQSYNVATARLGTELGIERVLDTAKRLGVERALPPYASTLLGAAELTPFEVAQMYQTIASGGWRTPLRAIREVVAADGRPLGRYSLSVEQAFAPEPVYLLIAAMQDVVREGTGQALAAWLAPETAIAGKTGTSDAQRDGWFAGFSGDRLAVVWIGYDDNREGRLTGASAALPVWGDTMAALDPEPLELPKPDTIERVWVDPKSGLRAEGCPGAIELPFVAGSAPAASAGCGGTIEQAVGGALDQLRGWIDRLFGR